MNATQKAERDSLRDYLKSARKNHGRNSIKVFKIIKNLKTKYPEWEGESVEYWADHATSVGSFVGMK